MTTKTESAHDVRKVLQGVKDFYRDPAHIKLTEADTRAHFIDPLLRALGYHAIGAVQHEVFVPDAKQFLDYQLLVDGAARVAVEAKALDVTLTDAHGAQVVQYCSVLGVEWAVVTNARQWRLYDAFAKGPLAEKLVLATALVDWDSDAEYVAAFDQLWLISKDAFLTSDGPAAWIASRRVDGLLRHALTDPGSQEVKYLRKRLLDQGVTASREEVAMWFESRLDSAAPQTMPAVAPPAIEPPVAAFGTSPKAAPAVDAVGTSYYLAPVADIPEETARETIERLVGSGLWAFSAGTPNRTRVKPGDRIAFYQGPVGVVAEAVVETAPEDAPMPEIVKDPMKYRYTLRLRDAHLFVDEPVAIDAAMRARLDAFADRDPHKMWAWFVFATRRVSEHDFALLTGQSATID